MLNCSNTVGHGSHLGFMQMRLKKVGHSLCPYLKLLTWLYIIIMQKEIFVLQNAGFGYFWGLSKPTTTANTWLVSDK